MLPLAIIGMLPVIGKNDDIVGGVSAVVVTAECIALFVTIFCRKSLSKEI